MPDLSEMDLNKNKTTFITLLRTNITREGANIDALVSKLEASDFFYAPASTKYHANYRGGLCQHSLNVYNNLKSLVYIKGLEGSISEETITICSLLHDLSKMNFYVPSFKNRKVYYEAGSKKDDGGNYDWVSEKCWATIPDEERFIYGNHEETSEFMIRAFIPLSHEEAAAILNHHGGVGYDSTQGNIASKVMAKYPLAALLHIADMLSTFIDEKINE